MIKQTMTLNERKFSCRASLKSDVAGAEDLPLIVALHGGTYTSRYFDVPGYSLLGRAEVLGVPIIALDRPGYGSTMVIDPGDTSHCGNAAILNAAFLDLWEHEGQDRAGIVLIGHSIGGAIALRIAGLRPSWPLLGVAVSGIGLRNASHGAEMRGRLPLTSFVEVPRAFKNHQMFGAAETFLAGMLDAIQLADAPAPRQELIDIATTWPREVLAVLAKIEVPVHYRMADQDNLWMVTHEEVQDFVAACSAAPRVDAGIIENAGHCIDFHRAGAGFQLEQIAFALRCALDDRFMGGHRRASAPIATIPPGSHVDM